MSNHMSIADALVDAEVFTDGDWVESKDQDPDGDVRLTQLADVGDGNWINKSARFLTSEKAEQLRCTYLKAGDLLVARMPDPLGRCCVFPGDPMPCVTVVDVCIIRPNQQKIDNRYLMQVINSPHGRQGIARHITGTTRQRISRKNLGKVEIPLPPLAEQKRIAGILDAADDLRAKRRESLAQLDTLLQSTFLDMFGDPVTNPMGWAERSLGQLASGGFRNGLSPSNKGLVDGVVLTLSAITGSRFDFSAKKGARFVKAPASSQMLSVDTFLICRGNGNKRLVGTGAFPDRCSDEVCFPDTMIGVTVDAQNMTASYLENVWSSQRVRRQIERGARTTNGTHKVNQQLLSSIALPLPPLDLQHRFAKIVESVEQQKASQRAHLAELDTLFASLQSRAFRGEL